MNYHFAEKFRRVTLSLCFLIFAITGCASRNYIAHDYDEVLEKLPVRTKRTVVLFLVDGLSEQTLTAALVGMPNLKSYFRTDQGIFRAHSPFPSLTFPGISSLLKQKPISQTQFIGNRFFYDDDLVDFERPFERKTFGKLMTTDTLFSRLTAKRERSISLDYGLGIQASSFSPLEDLTTLIEIAEGNYAYVDDKKIEAVELLLSKYPTHPVAYVYFHTFGRSRLLST